MKKVLFVINTLGGAGAEKADLTQRPALRRRLPRRRGRTGASITPCATKRTEYTLFPSLSTHESSEMY